MLVSFTLGRYDTTVLDVLKVAANQLFGMETPNRRILPLLRRFLPRVIAASLSAPRWRLPAPAIRALQNPMVSPDLLGVGGRRFRCFVRALDGRQHVRGATLRVRVRYRGGAAHYFVSTAVVKAIR